MKTVCIYHSIDLDGQMSAAIVKHWYEKEHYGNTLHHGNVIVDPNEGLHNLTFIGYNYGQPIPDLSEYDKVIMCDISFPKDIMSFLLDKFKENFIWIDHHISALTENNSIWKNRALAHIRPAYPEGLRNTNYAACELTWKYFFPESNGADYHSAHIPSNLKGENIPLPKNEMPEIVRLLGMYDSFRHKGTDEEQEVLEFQYGARQVISNYEEAYEVLIRELEENEDCEMLNYDETIIYEIHTKGRAIYKYLCTDAKQSYKNGFEVKLVENVGMDNGPIRKFICINKERFNPINFGIDYHSEGYDGAMCWHLGSDKMVNISFYNDNGKVDCSAIAKSFGGGGHRGAAGCRMTIKEFQNLIK